MVLQVLCKKPFLDFGCGQCLTCRINKNRVLTHRIMLESTLLPDNSFMTLTYNPQHLPVNGSLNRGHLQGFYKRLRYYFPKIRAFSVGEYGDDNQRPHYHAALFGLACLGRVQRIETGARCYCDHCERVRSVWGFGNITLDELNPVTAAYIGGYVIKKMTSPDDPRLDGRYPEFAMYPTRPGLAAGAVPVIVDALNSEFGRHTFEHGDVPSSLHHGSKKFPLGRYLKTKIRKDMDLYKVNPETGEITYGTPHETISALKAKACPEVSAMQQSLRDHSSDASYEKFDQLKSESVSTRLQKVRNIETKHAIYRKARSL